MTREEKPTTRIIAAWAAPVSGHGWENSPIKYLVVDGDGNLELRFIQPNEQTLSMSVLYSVSSAVSREMTAAVASKLKMEVVT